VGLDDVHCVDYPVIHLTTILSGCPLTDERGHFTPADATAPEAPGAQATITAFVAGERSGRVGAAAPKECVWR